MENGKREVEMLMDALLPLAIQMLEKHGEFFPYGGVIGSDGKVTHVGVKDPDTDRPRSSRLIEILSRDFGERAERGEIRACGIVCDMKIEAPGSSEASDAIRIHLEHRAAYCADVFIPYKRSETGAVVRGELFATKGTALSFV